MTRAEEAAQQLLSGASKLAASRRLNEQADAKLREARALLGATFIAKDGGPNIDVASLVLQAFAEEAESRGLRAQAERAKG